MQDRNYQIWTAGQVHSKYKKSALVAEDSQKCGQTLKYYFWTEEFPPFSHINFVSVQRLLLLIYYSVIIIFAHWNGNFTVP